jgi:hypothetical protein
MHFVFTISVVSEAKYPHEWIKLHGGDKEFAPFYLQTYTEIERFVSADDAEEVIDRTMDFK